MMGREQRGRRVVRCWGGWTPVAFMSLCVWVTDKRVPKVHFM